MSGHINKIRSIIILTFLLLLCCCCCCCCIWLRCCTKWKTRSRFFCVRVHGPYCKRFRLTNAHTAIERAANVSLNEMHNKFPKRKCYWWMLPRINKAAAVTATCATLVVFLFRFSIMVNDHVSRFATATLSYTMHHLHATRVECRLNRFISPLFLLLLFFSPLCV